MYRQAIILNYFFFLKSTVLSFPMFISSLKKHGKKICGKNSSILFLLVVFGKAVVYSRHPALL